MLHLQNPFFFLLLQDRFCEIALITVSVRVITCVLALTCHLSCLRIVLLQIFYGQCCWNVLSVHIRRSRSVHLLVKSIAMIAKVLAHKHWKVKNFIINKRLIKRFCRRWCWVAAKRLLALLKIIIIMLCFAHISTFLKSQFVLQCQLWTIIFLYLTAKRIHFIWC